MPRACLKYDPEIKSVKIYRFYREDDLKVVLPDGSSYLVTVEEVRAFLKKYIQDDLVVDRAVDGVWNFYGIEINFETGYWETIDPEHNEYAYLMPDALQGLEWIM